MNGIIVLSLDSGMPIFEESITKNFGLPGNGIGSDAMQLSAVIFALYKTASAMGNSTDSAENMLTYLTMGQSTLHFADGEANGLSFLVVISMHTAFDAKSCKDILRRLLMEFKSMFASADDAETTDKQFYTRNKFRKDFRIKFLRLIDVIYSELAYDVYKTVIPRLNWITVCAPEDIPGYWTETQLSDWVQEQYSIYESQPSAHSRSSTGTLPSLSSLGLFRGAQAKGKRGSFLGNFSNLGVSAVSRSVVPQAPSGAPAAAQGSANSPPSPLSPRFRHVLLGSEGRLPILPPLDHVQAVQHLYEPHSPRFQGGPKPSPGAQSDPSLLHGIPVAYFLGTHRDSTASTPTRESLGLQVQSSSPGGVSPFVHVLEAHGVLLLWLCVRPGRGRPSDPSDCTCCMAPSMTSSGPTFTTFLSFCLWSRTLFQIPGERSTA